MNDKKFLFKKIIETKIYFKIKTLQDNPNKYLLITKHLLYNNK